MAEWRDEPQYVVTGIGIGIGIGLSSCGGRDELNALQISTSHCFLCLCVLQYRTVSKGGSVEHIVLGFRI